MGQKWTDAQRKKFIRTMKAKRNGGGKEKISSAFPPGLERALYDHYRQRVISELLRKA